MKLKTLSIAILLSAFSSISMANTIQNTYNDEAFDPDAKITLNETETKEVQARLDQDKLVSSRMKQENDRRNSAIIKCSQLLDDRYSPESIEKTKQCLQSNNGFFPEQYQMKNAQPLDAMNNPIVQKPTTRPIAPMQQEVQSQPANNQTQEVKQPIKDEPKPFNPVKDIFN